MTAAHLALLGTHALYVLAAVLLVVEAARLRRPLKRFLDRLERGDLP